MPEAGWCYAGPAFEGTREMRGIAVAHLEGDLGHAVNAFINQPDRLTAARLIEQVFKKTLQTFRRLCRVRIDMPSLLATACSPRS